jgi:hypothetical protein
MRTDNHPEQPPDDRSCDCGGCLEFRAIHSRLSPEPPLHERIAKRARDRAAQRSYDESDGHQPTRQAA